MQERVAEREAKELQALGVDKTTSGSTGTVVDSAFIRACIWEYEVGDGKLFAALHRDKLVYNHNSQEWLVWRGHYWEVDKFQFALAETATVVTAYKDEIKRIKEDIDEAKFDKKTEIEKFLKNLKDAAIKSKNRLLRSTGRANCLKNAVSIHNPLAISGFELDQNPWLLACKNGVINLKTGELGPGHPSQYITMASPIEYPGAEAKVPERWRKFLDEIFDGDTEKIMYLLKILGYGITGLKIVHIFVVLYGRHGRNGKSTIVNVLKHLLGPLAMPIQKEMLMKQQFGRSSAGPSPDIMNLKGRRIIFASEPDEGQKFDVGQIKWLTGGDELTARAPHDKMPTTFPPSHLSLLLSNEMPSAKADDDAFWHRLRKINFPFSFVDEPDPKKKYQKQADQLLEENLKEEAPLILADLVRGCILWQKQGLKMPDSVKNETDEWRQDEDELRDFVIDCLDDGDPKSVTRSSMLQEVLKNWWRINRDKNLRYIPGRKKFGSYLAGKYEKTKTDGGYAAFRGVRLRSDLDLAYMQTPDD